jgi:acetolactate synthase small subunit
MAGRVAMTTCTAPNTAGRVSRIASLLARRDLGSGSYSIVTETSSDQLSPASFAAPTR